MPKGVREPIEVRFWRFVTKGDGCWGWTGATNGQDNRAKLGNRIAARVAWELTNGPIPKGKWVLHRCDNPNCVRPDHLFLGTRADNMRDAFEKGRGNFQRNPDLLPRGEQHQKAKLTEAQAAEIYKRRHAGERVKVLALEFEVSGPTITNIAQGKYWRSASTNGT